VDATRRRWAEVPPNVWGLGLTSLFTDASSELVTSVLPLYLVVHRGLSPLGFGLVDGLQQGLAATLSLGSGLLSDRLGRHKRVAAAGYAVSAVCRLALLPAGAQLSALAAITAADRIGKSIRTPSRDALLSLSARPEALGFAFGVHRSLDAAGALLGPLLAFALLARRPVGFEELFVVAFLVATGGLAALLLLVRDVRPAAASIPAPPPALGRLLADPAPRRLALAAAVLGLATVGDGFVFLAFQSASADNHPIHYDREYCRRRGHPDLLAHGFQVLIQTAAGAGNFAHVIGDALIGFLDQSSKFLKPVYAGDTLECRLVVTALDRQRTTGVVTLRSTAHNQRGELCMEGTQRYLLRLALDSGKSR